MSDKKKKIRGVPFKKGEDPRRNDTGMNKGHRWKKTLLKQLMSLELSESEQQQFIGLKNKFPSLFGESETRNFQLFMELKQVSLAFSTDAKVAQAAIKEIKDRIDGKASQEVKVIGGEENGSFGVNHKLFIKYENLTELPSEESDIEE